jgi:hypothetical protein
MHLRAQRAGRSLAPRLPSARFAAFRRGYGRTPTPERLMAWRLQNGHTTPRRDLAR